MNESLKEQMNGETDGLTDWLIHSLSTRPRNPLAARIAHPITANVATEISTLELMVDNEFKPNYF